MECNKDEALRVMEMAERKFAMQDYTAAKRLLLKAQQLYPTFENASRMLAVVEVHTIAQGKASGTEIDCYQLLQVDSSADDLIIKKNYRRLALMLHPDKNKSPGAEAAFKLVGEAWAVLSDKTKRWIYDTKRLPSGKEGTANSKWNQSQGSSQTFSCNTGTFWTACSHCKMQYEYYRTYLNFNLKCQKCLRIFVANDIYSVSENGMNRPYGWPGSRADAQQSQAFKSQQGQNVHVGDNLPRSGTVPAAAKRVPNAAIGRENMSKANTSPNEVNKCQTVFEEVKINSGVARQKSSRNAEQDVDIVNNKRKEKEEKIKRSTKKQQTIDVLLMKRKKKEEESTANCQVEDPFNMKRTKKATLSYNQNGQEQDEEYKKLNTLVSDSQHRWHGAAVDSEIRRSSRARRDVDYNFDSATDDDLVAFPRSRCDKTDLGAIAKSQKDSRPYLVHQNLERQPNSDEHGFPVPDPDFYNFDQDRTEKSFGVGQIWAVYDDVNGMPSYYCRIMKVLTNTSFGVRMKWLEALPFSKNMFGKISGLSAACGKFEYSKKLRTENEINLFSHVMRVDSPNKDPVKIYPRRGEVWALFKDWDSEEFRSSTTDHAKNWKYEIVEILTEYSEDMGVNIASLVKLDGYTTVFTRQVKAVFKWFPSTELSRFSHMVPSWKIVGKGSVDGSWDLDPASLPLELMHEPTKPQCG